MSDHGMKGKFTVNEVGLKIPLVVRWPNKIEPYSTSEQLVSMVDILPTLIESVGGKTLDDIDGLSFSSLLLGEDKQIRKYIFGVSTRQNIQACYIFPSRSVRDNRYKYIRNYNALELLDQNLGDNEFINNFIKRGANKFSHVPYEELYDLQNDPYEHNNLAMDYKYRLVKNRLSVVLIDWMKNQEDILLKYKTPLIKPTLHYLDRTSKWNKPDVKLLGTLKDTDYIKLHY